MDFQAAHGLECLGICVCVCVSSGAGWISGQWMHARMDVHGLLLGYVARALRVLVVVRSLLLRVCVWVDVCSRWALLWLKPPGRSAPGGCFPSPRPRL